MEWVSSAIWKGKNPKRGQKLTMARWWQLKHFWNSHPYLGKISHLTSIFSDGLVQPPTGDGYSPFTSPAWEPILQFHAHRKPEKISTTIFSISWVGWGRWWWWLHGPYHGYYPLNPNIKSTNIHWYLYIPRSSRCVIFLCRNSPKKPTKRQKKIHIWKIQVYSQVCWKSFKKKWIL